LKKTTNELYNKENNQRREEKEVDATRRTAKIFLKERRKSDSEYLM